MGNTGTEYSCLNQEENEVDDKSIWNIYGGDE